MAESGFFWEFLGKVGAPIFAATLVGCLLSERFDLVHGTLLGTGLAMMALSHWRSHNRRALSSAT